MTKKIEKERTKEVIKKELNYGKRNYEREKM